MSYLYKRYKYTICPNRFKGERGCGEDAEAGESKTPVVVAQHLMEDKLRHPAAVLRLDFRKVDRGQVADGPVLDDLLLADHDADAADFLPNDPIGGRQLKMNLELRHGRKRFREVAKGAAAADVAGLGREIDRRPADLTTDRRWNTRVSTPL